MKPSSQKGNWSKVAIPVTNESNYDITLIPRTVLGELKQVKAIYPVDVRPATSPNDSTASAPETLKEEHRPLDACQSLTNIYIYIFLTNSLCAQGGWKFTSMRWLQGAEPKVHFPISLIQDMLNSLRRSVWFSVLDQGKAYHQGFLDESSRPLTAFITQWGLNKWVRIPFGLSSAPAEFQRSMEECLAGWRDESSQPYLDDNLVHSKSFEDHLHDMREVLHSYQANRVKLTAKK